MKKKSMMLLSMSPLVLASMMYVGWASVNSPDTVTTPAPSEQATTAQPKQAATFAEPMPYADTTVLVEEEVKGERVVTRYEIAADGSWRQEIMEHYDPSGVGLVTAWDNSKKYSYDPTTNRLIIADPPKTTSRFMPNQILSQAYPLNIKNSAGKAAKVEQEGDLDVYTVGKERYKIDTKDGFIKQIDLLDEYGAIVGHVTVKDVKPMKHDKSRFQIDPAGKIVEHVHDPSKG
ncbi:hypothetical protein OS242_12780 [Tumebacillus sp. DT12]|uniref:Uncharacterized protein n=1 Tax=Tumebacillus lacus TaxID=2995335 RepID=A0ABT3X1P2_9BACL|nr:hypothetical protein [Tumebacillus lacus]MCX7570834.1 hypothetical protein [Tumebacillus lacus]